MTCDKCNADVLERQTAGGMVWFADADGRRHVCESAKPKEPERFFSHMDGTLVGMMMGYLPPGHPEMEKMDGAQKRFRAGLVGNPHIDRRRRNAILEEEPFPGRGEPFSEEWWNND